MPLGFYPISGAPISGLATQLSSNPPVLRSWGLNTPSVTWGLNLSVPTNQFVLFYACDQTLSFSTATPTNISGWTIQYTLRQSFRGTALVTLTTTGGGVTITDSVNGVFTVKFTAAQLSQTNESSPGSLPVGSVPGLFYGDAERTDAGNVTTLTSDKIQILSTFRLP